ncbi:hypothetical protein ABT47_07810 [Shewanella xiamenensis]|nr:hypothetical protein ABT47_07810 [Shewanella xiamenensis]
MPTRTVHYHDSMAAKFGAFCNQLQVLVHYFLINEWRDDGFSFSCCRTDCAEEMHIFKLLLF